MYEDVAFPTKKSSSGGGGSPLTRARKRYLRVNDLPFVQLQTSDAIPFQGFLFEAQSVDQSLTPDQINVEVFVCGAGSSGTDDFGGFPGTTNFGEFCLADVDPMTLITFDIGAGGQGSWGGWGAQGSDTVFAPDLPELKLIGRGGPQPSSNSYAEQASWAQAAVWGSAILDPTAGVPYFQHNPRGPGCGGKYIGDYDEFNTAGGIGNAASSRPTAGSTEPGTPGNDADADDFFGVGGGGCAATNDVTNGSDGGYPGAGGGGGSTPGNGANGVIRYRYFIWELTA